jgi:hypothetical protein
MCVGGIMGAGDGLRGLMVVSEVAESYLWNLRTAYTGTRYRSGRNAAWVVMRVTSAEYERLAGLK